MWRNYIAKPGTWECRAFLFGDRTLKRRIILFLGIGFLVLFGYLFGFYLTKRISVTYNGDLYQGSDVLPQKLEVKRYSWLGIGYRLNEDQYEQTFENGRAMVSYKDCNASCNISVVPFDHLDASYYGNVHAGDLFESMYASVSAVFADGMSRKVDASYDFSGMFLDSVDIPVYTVYGEGVLSVDCVPVDHIELTYDVPCYPGDFFDVSAVKAKAVLMDGVSFTCDILSSEYPKERIFDDFSFTVDTMFGTGTCDVSLRNTSGVHAVQTKSVYPGGSLSSSDVLVYLGVAGKSRRELSRDDYTFDGAGPFDEDTDVTIPTQFGDTTLHVDVSAIVSVEPVLEEQDVYRPGDHVIIKGATVLYEDGRTDLIDASELTFLSGWEDAMVSGENTYEFSYGGVSCSFVREAAAETNVSQATKALSQEIAESYKYYISDHTFVTVRRYKYHEGSYYLSHVIIDSPSQIRSGLSYDSYGGQREEPTHASERLNWVIGTNGGNFSYATGGADTGMAKAIIKNGSRMPDSGSFTNGMEICLTSGGALFSPPAGVSVSELLGMGVTDTFSCGDTLLISDGKQVNVGVQSNQYRYPRTAIGMVQPGEYYFITAGSGNYGGGMTYDEIRRVLWDNGCTFGKCMDGGGSSSLVFRGELINPPAGGSERAVADFLYFTDLEADLIVGDDLFYSPHSYTSSGDGIWIEDLDIEITDLG